MSEDRAVLWKSLIAEFATGAQMWRMPGWTARVALVLDGSPFVVAQAVGGELLVEDWRLGGPAPTTTVSATAEALGRWLDGEDFTHLVKSGGLQVLAGTYFDLLLLSKALRLRPEMTRGVSA